MILSEVEPAGDSVKIFKRVAKRAEPFVGSRSTVHSLLAKWQPGLAWQTGFEPVKRRAWAWPCVLALLLGFSGATWANTAQQGLRQERVAEVLRRHTLRYGPWKAENLELRLLQFPGPSIPAGPARYQVLQPTKLSNPGAHNFYLAVEVAGREVARLWIKAEIRVFERVVVAAAPLARGVLIGARDLRVERRETTRRRNRPFTRIQDVVGQQSSRVIEANEVLRPNAVSRPTLIKRGSAIKLVFETARLRVETAGVAQESGKAGELIQVKNPSSGRILRGVVLDGRRVRLN